MFRASFSSIQVVVGGESAHLEWVGSTDWGPSSVSPLDSVRVTCGICWDRAGTVPGGCYDRLAQGAIVSDCCKDMVQHMALAGCLLEGIHEAVTPSVKALSVEYNRGGTDRLWRAVLVVLVELTPITKAGGNSKSESDSEETTNGDLVNDRVRRTCTLPCLASFLIDSPSQWKSGFVATTCATFPVIWMNWKSAVVHMERSCLWLTQFEMIARISSRTSSSEEVMDICGSSPEVTTLEFLLVNVCAFWGSNSKTWSAFWNVSVFFARFGSGCEVGLLSSRLTFTCDLF